MTKYCPGCGTDKPDSEYYRSATSKDGLQRRCKGCQGAYWRGHYSGGRGIPPGPRRRAFNERRYAKIATMRAVLAEYKLSKGCADCGYNKSAVALDFDHLDPADKAFTISNKLGNSPDKIWAEVAKCEVVCANCHRIRTHTKEEKVSA